MAQPPRKPNKPDTTALFKSAVGATVRAVGGKRELEVTFSADRPILTADKARLANLPRLPTRMRDVARASEAKPPAGVSARDAAKPATPEADDFPEITVANVVWHPEADRRRASVTIDQTPLADAREGDILKGIEVEKIEPGAVEFKLGSELKTVRIGP